MRWLPVMLLMCAAVPVQAQQSKAEQWLAGPYEEHLAGAIGNTLLRGPWMAKGWRKPIPRLLIWSTLSSAYECCFDRAHGGRWDKVATRDFLEREAGYLAVEGIVVLAKKVF